jgi:Shedu protein SduA, C-terminal
VPIEWETIQFAQPGRLIDVDFALRRLPNRVYWSGIFTLQFESSRDVGQPARYVTRVFDTFDESDPTDERWEWMEGELYRSPAGRVQVRAMVAREAGAVRQIRIEKVTASKLETLVTLHRDRAQALIDFVKSLEYVPLEGDGARVHMDEQLLRDLFEDPNAMSSLYARSPEQFRDLIRDDATAQDLAALAHRREVVHMFRSWLEDEDLFDTVSAEAGGPERAWQKLFEANPWILGIGLGGQLLTSWDDERLEQVVGGQTIQESGKRIDALLRTQGSISSMVLAEVKHHRQDLLASTSYRPGCWAPSKELAGGVVQAQQTAYRASQDLRGYVADRAPDDSDLNTGTFVVRPRSYLVIGRLDEMVSSFGGVHRDKFRSFELYRRNLYEPEILTFDEVLARAEWQISQLDAEQNGDAW